jgi:hypothetical protein
MGAEVRAAEPLVTEPTVIPPAVARVDAAPEEIAAADIVVLLTDYDAFLATDIGRYARYVLDCRRVLSSPERRDTVRPGSALLPRTWLPARRSLSSDRGHSCRCPIHCRRLGSTAVRQTWVEVA